jgi:hypothetical protein
MVPRCIALGKTIHVYPADQMTDYNKLPTAIVISFTYKYFGHLDVEIIVKLHTSKFVQFMRVAQCRQRNSASARRQARGNTGA